MMIYELGNALNRHAQTAIVACPDAEWHHSFDSVRLATFMGRVHEDPYLWRAISAMYGARALDHVCEGFDRHVRFAGWLMSTQGQKRTFRLYRRFQREANRQIRPFREQIARLQWRISVIETSGGGVR